MYTFEMHIEERPVLLIFCGRNQGSDFDYGEALDQTLKAFSGSYSAIIFLAPEYLKDLINNLIFANDRLVSNISRYGQNTSIKFYSFDGYGALTKFYTIESLFDFKLPNESLVDLIVHYGIHDLLNRRAQSIILTAPPGTTFKKPSNDEYTEFIKAGELAIGCAENLFVAFCLLTKRPQSFDVKKIYIDSSSISAFVVALISYMREFTGSSMVEFSYQSFNSYDGLEVSEPDFKGDAWVIISASTSNNLGGRILEKWKGLNHEQIVTLLSYKNTELSDGGAIGLGDKIVANISKFSTRKDSKKKSENLIPIKIIGENFTAQIDPPELVILKKVHLPAAAREFLIENSKMELFSFNKYDGRKTRSIYFNSDTYLSSKNSDNFNSWLSSVAVWNIPYGIKYVIYNKNDSAAEKIFKLLKNMLPEQVLPIDVNYIDQVEYDDCSVIIISPVISSGRIFLKANRDLRMKEHSGPRIFLSICSLFKSQKSFSMFERSLLQAPGDYKYKFFSYKTLFVGDTENIKGWNNELKVAESLTSDLFSQRSNDLRNVSKGIPRGIGFSFSEQNIPLHFNKDFAFWGVDYKPEEINHGAVYLSIAAVLQHLRDKPSEEDDSLYHHVYKHAVIDPENFSRFNEGLIQAILWRAAEDIETNYKYLPEVSSSFDSILLNLARDAGEGGVNGLADLLFGVAVGKIQLHDNSLAIIFGDIRSLTKNIVVIQELIDYIERVVFKGENPLDVGAVF